ncbi:hypothetical protein ACNKHR_11310 [Shigella flexneri]
MSILAALVDSLVDIGASSTNRLVVRYSLQPADQNHSLATVKPNPSPRWRKVCFSGSALSLFLTGIIISYLQNR